MRNPNPLPVAVVGGGVIGVSTAQQLARAGADVVLLTEGELTSNASGRSLSWLNSAGVLRESYHRLRMAGIDRYRTLSARHPDANWLRFDGGLTWTAEDQSAQLDDRHQHALAHGYDSRRLSPEEVAAYTPGVDPAAIPAAGALWNPGEGWVDLPSLVRLLVQDFLECGGKLVTRAGPSVIVTEARAVTGVRTERGDFYPAGAAVLATGPAVPAMAAALDVIIPDATPVSLLVTTEPVEVELTAVLNTPRVSVRPTPAGALAVDADWTAASITRAGDGSYRVPPAVVEELLAEASALLAGHPELRPARCGMGPKPIPADGEPVLGRVEEITGLHVAFTHSGATLGLIAGELLAYEITQGSAHPMLADFTIRRFG